MRPRAQAAALRALNTLWGLSYPPERLEAIALALGSDVPVCVRQTPRLMQGRGERLAPAPGLPSYAMLLVNPGVEVATPQVFAGLTQRSGAALPAMPPRFETFASFAAWLAEQRNDLEAPARILAPVIGTVLDALGAQQGCALARMSGSGATCFGLFENANAAQMAAAALGRAHPTWWMATGAAIAD